MNAEYDPEIEAAALVNEAFAEAAHRRPAVRVEMAAMALAEPIAVLNGLAFEHLKLLESGDLPMETFRFRLTSRGLAQLDIKSKQPAAPTNEKSSELLSQYEKAHVALDAAKQAQIAMYGLRKREIQRAEAIARTLWLELDVEELPEEGV